MKNLKSLKLAVGFVISVFFLSSCASIFSGSTDDVMIKSEPDKAEIYINGTYKGTTPLKVELKRGKSHHIEIKAKDYEPYILLTDNSFNGLVCGNIICGGIIGLIIDFASGSAWNVKPDFVMAKMKKLVSQVETSNGEPEIINVLDRHGNSIGTVQIEWQ